MKILIRVWMCIPQNLVLTYLLLTCTIPYCHSSHHRQQLRLVSKCSSMPTLQVMYTQIHVHPPRLSPIAALFPIVGGSCSYFPTPPCVHNSRSMGSDGHAWRFSCGEEEGSVATRDKGWIYTRAATMGHEGGNCLQHADGGRRGLC